MNNEFDLFNPNIRDSGELKHTEESIIKILRAHFNQGYKYRLGNAFIYASDWECDFFCINQEGYAFEFEIKISKADFQNDFQKYKHMLFKKPDKYGLLLPNKFFYVVPEGLISADDIPKYAGLIYIVGGHLKIVKRAPFIHKVKRDYRKVLCDKFYERYIQQRRDYAADKYMLQNAKFMFEQLSKYLPVHEQNVLRHMNLLK